MPWYLLLACGPPPDVTVEVETDAPVAVVSERYLSFAVDTGQVVGGIFWNPDTGSADPELEVPSFDFDRPRLRALTAELAPAYLRVGGTLADGTFYDLDGTPSPPPAGYDHVLTAAHWDGMVRFADDLGLRLMFTLNVGPGPRTAEGAWDPANARELLRHAQGDPVDVWELGNEVSAFPVMHGFSVSAGQYGEDLAAARALVDAEAPGAALAGPTSAYWPVLGEAFAFYEPAMAAGGAQLDVVTWHYYPQQSSRCAVASRPAGPEVMLEPDHLDEVARWAEEVEAGRDAHAPGVPVWMGETGNAQCGGEPGVSDAFAGGFWWLDQLGLLARRGQQVVVRQTLAGSDYGLLDAETLEPRPDYWTSVLWRRLMGPEVLAARHDGGPELRVWAHCAGPDTIAYALVHVGSEERVVDLGGPAERWIFTAPSLDSRDVALNGEPLALEGDALPPLEGARGRHVVMPPRSYGFARVSAAAAACAPLE